MLRLNPFCWIIFVNKKAATIKQSSKAFGVRSVICEPLQNKQGQLMDLGFCRLD